MMGLLVMNFHLEKDTLDKLCSSTKRALWNTNP